MIDITHKDNHATFLIPRDGEVEEAEVINKLINMLKPSAVSFYFSMNFFTVCNPYEYFDNSFYLLRQIVVLERTKKEIYHIVNRPDGKISIWDMGDIDDTPDSLMDPPTEFNEDERGI